MSQRRLDHIAYTLDWSTLQVHRDTLKMRSNTVTKRRKNPKMSTVNSLVIFPHLNIDIPIQLSVNYRRFAPGVFGQNRWGINVNAYNLHLVYAHAIGSNFCFLHLRIGILNNFPDVFLFKDSPFLID